MKLEILFVLVFSYIHKVSSRKIESASEQFDRERYERSRSRPKSKPFNPVVVNNEKALDFVAIVNAYGYPAEEHTVKTTDGYKLRIHRIPGSPKNLEMNGKPIIFMQHGLLASSDEWILMEPSNGLVYMLADVGFDVWLGNARGNTYSRKHVSLSPDHDQDFWRYSFHEIALYDITAVIDYILQLTNEHQLIYIGHSMGTTISYILLSEKPEYNNKIKLVISLSPVAFWHKKSNILVNFLTDHADTIKTFLEIGNVFELFPQTTIISDLMKRLCTNSSPYHKLCIRLLNLSVGYNPEPVNTNLLLHLLTYLPAGASTQTWIHFSQIIESGNFQMFDYGTIENLNIYKQKEPPLYNITNIVAPVALFYGKGDTLIPAEGAIEFSKKLPNVFTIEAVPSENFNHLDFFLCRDVKTLLNNRLVEIAINSLNCHKNTSQYCISM